MKQFLTSVVSLFIIVAIVGYFIFRGVESTVARYVGNSINKAASFYFQLGGSTPTDPDPYKFAQVLSYKKEIRGFVIPEGYNYHGIYVPDDRSS